MICTQPVPLNQMEMPSRTTPGRRGRRDRLLTQSRQTEQPLLDWIANEQQKADGLNRSSAMRAARRLLNEAFAAVTHGEMKHTHMEDLR